MIRLGTVLICLAGLAGCEETRGELGDECLRDEDCLSGRCSARECTAPPPVTDEREEGE